MFVGSAKMLLFKVLDSGFHTCVLAFVNKIEVGGPPLRGCIFSAWKGMECCFCIAKTVGSVERKFTIMQILRRL